MLPALLFLILRSLLFALGFWASLLIYLPALPVVWLLPMRQRFIVLRSWNWLVVHWLRLTCGVRWRVEARSRRGAG